ncbi:glucose-1-phosphate thymidylyltransferase, partial [Rhodovarius crocodyli]
GLVVACPEEIGFNQGWLNAEQLAQQGRALGKTAYGQYMIEVAGGAR